MPIFGRGFPSKFKAFGVISGVSLVTEDTLTNTGVASQSLTSAEAQNVSQSGNATQALSVEATKEPNKDNQGTASQNLALDATADTDSSSAIDSQTITLERTADTETNSGSSVLAMAVEATKETISNSAAATISIGETIDLGADNLTNSASSSQTINESHAESGGGSGTGDPRLSESIAETVSNSATATILISDFQTESEVNVGTGSPTIAEATSESVSNSATATILISDFQSEQEANTGTGAATIVEATSETVANTGTATLRIADTIPEPDMTNRSDGSQFISEATAESVSNSATSDQTIAEAQPGDDLGNTGTGTISYSEAIAENVTNSANSSQTISESTVEELQNSATNTPSLIDFDTETPVNTGTGSHFTDGEKIAEMDTVAFLASLTMDDQRDVTVVPFSDISTGTWTVAPLYEKVDELIVASGYPTETIRSGNNPSNDKAILKLSPVSDPGIDNNHFINVEFYKDGSENLDFTLNLKEGSNLIATRTFTDVQETEGVPRRERIALTTLEASAIVDYSNLNIELIANQTS